MGGRIGRKLGPSASREVHRQFWRLIRAGETRQAAAAALGMNEYAGRDWFRQAGGVVPAYVTAEASGRYLALSEREEILVGVEGGETIRAIARRLHRAPSTVWRELRRNMRQRYRLRYRGRECVPGWGTRRWDYRPSRAQRRAEILARRPKAAKLATNRGLHDLVQAQLHRRHSPEQIACMLRRQFPENRAMWVSPETIYQSIYVQSRGALRRELAVHLRTGRRLRHPHRPADARRHRIPDMINIRERPPSVEDRAVPGHWEGDLILGKAGRSAIGTLVERATRYVTLLHLPDGHGPLEVQAAMIAATRRLPEQLWKSLTWDQGVEMHHHRQISIATGLDIYFCDPGKPWQRGSNENTNGLLRQYFPKGTDLSQHSAADLEFVADELNTRPRKTLGWIHPAEALDRLFSSASKEAGVAPTT
ncbi:MAG TPA: IS30 family transposase [Candidatus Dormibacteraeota bacterium]